MLFNAKLLKLLCNYCELWFTHFSECTTGSCCGQALSTPSFTRPALEGRGHGHPRAQSRPSSLREPVVLERTRDPWALPTCPSSQHPGEHSPRQPSNLPRRRMAAPGPITVLKGPNTNRAKALVMNS